MCDYIVKKNLILLCVFEDEFLTIYTRKKLYSSDKFRYLKIMDINVIYLIKHVKRLIRTFKNIINQLKALTLYKHCFWCSQKRVFQIELVRCVYFYLNIIFNFSCSMFNEFINK